MLLARAPCPEEQRDPVLFGGGVRAGFRKVFFHALFIPFFASSFMRVAFANSGKIHDPSVADVSILGDWNFDPLFLIPLLLAFLYFRGLRGYRKKGGRRFPRWRPPLFTVGLVFVALALVSPVDRLAEVSFTWHMFQHQWLMFVAIPLLLLGAPFLPVVWGLPKVLRRWVFIPFAKNFLVRFFFIQGTRPLPALVLMQFALLIWHMPENYDRALLNEALHYLQHVIFMVTAALFWWNLVSPYPFPSRLNPLMRMAFLVLSSIFNSALSAFITFADSVLFGYDRLIAFWGSPMLADQTLGGLLMWVIGAMMHLFAIGVIFFAYATEERKKEPSRALYVAGARATENP